MATPTEKKAKVLLCKSDMDSHDRGIRYVAQVLRDAGMEVVMIYYVVPDEVASVAMQEDADVIGLSFYSAGVMHDTSTVLRLLKENNMEDKVVLVGGIVTERNIPRLLAMGVKGVFGPGTPITEVIQCINRNLEKARERVG